MIPNAPQTFINGSDFAKDEGGAITALNLFFVMVMAIVAGIAIDMSSLIQARTQLQVAADTAAHAALYTRDSENKTVAKQEALDIASAMMPTGRYGIVLRTENIHFGTYDKATKSFNIDEDSRAAVYVKTDRLSENANPVTSFLLRIVGFSDWDVVTTSVFETYRPTCLREGFVAEEIVDVQSNNGFMNGFCIHSNQHVSANQNNLFEAGTIVSMPDINDIDLASSGFEKNEGLEAALREGRLRLRIFARLKEIEAGMTNANSRYFRPYITDTTPIKIDLTANNNGLAMADLTSGRVHELTCTKPNGSLTMAGEIFSGVVIITNCSIKMSASTAIEEATIIITDDGADSMTAPSGLRLGQNDNCADGGGAQLLTYGGISNAAKVEMYGSQIIAVGSVGFAAANDGIEGASIISASEIDITSGSSMAFCGSGMDTIFEAEYFRMAG